MLAAKAILLSTMPVLQPHTLLTGRARRWPPFKHNEKVSIIIAPALAFAHSCIITHWSAQSWRVSSKVLDNAPVFRALDHSWSPLWPKCDAYPGTEMVVLLFCVGFNLKRKKKKRIVNLPNILESQGLADWRLDTGRTIPWNSLWSVPFLCQLGWEERKH